MPTPIIDLADLRARAALVGRRQDDHVSPHAAARALSGIMAIVSRQFGTAHMQAMATVLAGDAVAWDTRLCVLPRALGGGVDPALEMIATCACGVLPLAGAEGTRAAVAFWATERDPRVWQAVTAGLAA